MFDEKSIINIFLAMSSGVVAALGSHFHLRGRVNTMEATVKDMKQTQDKMMKQVGETRVDVAYIRGQMSGDDQ